MKFYPSQHGVFTRRSGRRALATVFTGAALLLSAVVPPSAVTQQRQPVHEESATAKNTTAKTATVPDLDAPGTKANQNQVVSPAEQRRRQLAEDTALLLRLATELKAEIDKTPKDTLSLVVIRKADEVGRLAHKLREEMKTTASAN